MKLYHGGCGTATGYIVAENEGKAIHDLSHKLGIPYLPVNVTEVVVEGYEITVTAKKGKKAEKEAPEVETEKVPAEEPEAEVGDSNGEEAVDSSATEEPVPTEPTGEDGGEVVEPDTEHCGEGEGNPGAERADKADGGKGRARKKPSK